MRTPALWLALLLVVAAVAPASALAAGQQADIGDATHSDAPRLTDGGLHLQTDDDQTAAPATSVEVSLRADRSAFWRVETRYALDTGNETRSFRALADRYESGDADVGPDAVLFETLTQRATEATGREMAIGNVTYHATVDDSEGYGTLALTFRWDNFLRAGDNGTLVLDDVFELPTAEEDQQRTWLSIFDDGQQIRISPPEGYTVTSTSIPVQQRENAVVLAEPSDFEGDGALRITYSSVGPRDQLPVGLLAGVGAVALLAVVAGGWMLRRRDRDTPPPAEPPATPDAEASDVPPAGADADGAAADTADNRETEAADDVDLSLLSDEERIEHLLERNDGRMKQATIVDEVGWSDAKVSQLLSAMAEEGRVDKLRLGRENLISLPDDGDEGDTDDGV
jgi:uncharacterized membrane protein